MPVPDPFREGLARGWKTYNGSQLTQDLTLEADVAIIGSGAGGGTTAEILSAAGYKVLLIEEGPLKTSSDFKLLEDQAYASLYQEGIGRMSKDGAITILQGRAVGGTTLINWTSSFRTPSRPWNTGPGSTTSRATAGRDGAVVRENGTAPGRRPWRVPPNANNDVIRKGCEKLGYSWHVIPRNVRGCWNLGYCGMGCPTNAKQSMMVTTIPATLEKGGELLYLARAEKLILRRQGHRPAMRGDGRALRRAHRTPHHGQGAALRAGGRRHQQPGAAAALRRAGPAQTAGQTHLSCIW
jgi:choline dehydrogenase-like flavoprotein